MRRASSTALTIVESPGAVSTRSAAARAASVAPLTAIPTSACLRAGASLTPSPVMATRCPRSCRALTMAYLCSGKTWAKPSALSIRSATSDDRWSRVAASASSSSAGWMAAPSPRRRAISRAMAVLSPVTIFTWMPCLSGLAYGLDRVLAGRIEQREYAQKAPSPARPRCGPRRGCGSPSRRAPRPACRRVPPLAMWFLRGSRITCGCALGDLEGPAVWRR